jgi:hypothetical protein
MPDITRYLQRISFLLRQGQPANDVGVYLPTDDAYAAFTPGSVSVNKMVDQLLGADLIPRILDAGYNFDFIDDGAIAHGGVPYRILILPNVERIPLATYRKIEEYAHQGGTVIFTGRKPSLAPGLREDGDTQAILALSQTHEVTDLAALPAALHKALAADVATAPEIGFVHRKLAFADVYFVVNSSNHAVHAPAVFRTKERGEQWDAVTGKTSPFAGTLDLAPYESRVLVFSNAVAPAPSDATGAAPATVELNGKWTIAFAGDPPVPTTLHSWADDGARKYFSGIATYQTNVPVPPALTKRRVFLDFGQGTPVATAEHNSGSGLRAMLEAPVREAAIVYIDGKRAGSVWSAPYQVEVTGLLHAGENQIRIEVANLAINELAKGPLPDYRALNAKYGERFQPQDMAHLMPLPSGILGPVRIVAR